jgi:hypothetical protein
MCLLNLIFLDKILDDEYIDFVDDWFEVKILTSLL